MSTLSPVKLSDQNAVILPLAALLQRLDDSATAVDPASFQALAARLNGLLAAATMDDTLQAILQAHPAASAQYENANYAHAGLCRSPLDSGLTAEQNARALLARVAR
jgi:hypothetical protein